MKKLQNYISVLALLVLTACGGATFINPDKNAVDFTIEGGEESVTIGTDGSWDISDCPEWVTTDFHENTLVIKTARNESGAVREGNIVLTGKEGVSATIKVTQASKCTRINPETDKVEFEKEGGTQTVKIDTDGSPQVEAPEGFTATFAGGVLTINAPANEGGGKNGEIKLTGDDQSATIAVTQKGNICPTCNGSGKVRCKKCGGRGYIIDGGGGDSGWYGCSSCGGSGYCDRYSEYDDYLGEVVSHIDDSHYHKGSGKMKCPTCGGSGH